MFRLPKWADPGKYLQRTRKKADLTAALYPKPERSNSGNPPALDKPALELCRYKSITGTAGLGDDYVVRVIAIGCECGSRGRIRAHDPAAAGLTAGLAEQTCHPVKTIAAFLAFQFILQLPRIG